MEEDTPEIQWRLTLHKTRWRWIIHLFDHPDYDDDVVVRRSFWTGRGASRWMIELLTDSIGDRPVKIHYENTKGETE
jgi:hypothetical protein